MNFKSALGGWGGSTVAAAAHSIGASLLIAGAMPAGGFGGVVLNAVFAGLIYAAMVFVSHAPFGKTPTILSGVITGIVFILGFMSYQGTAVALANPVVLLTALAFSVFLSVGMLVGARLFASKPAE